MTANDFGARELPGVRVGVIGAGYVGLTTAVCLAERGVDTVCVDVDCERIDALNSGVAPIDEPDIVDAIRSGLGCGALQFTTEYLELVDRDIVFVCVPTPSGPDGAADLRVVEKVVDQLGALLRPRAVVALKSTVPVGTTRRIAERLRDKGICVVSTPEFLREGHAVHDFRHPERLVVGALGDFEANVVGRAYGVQSAPLLRMSPESAELAKYASNAFLAVKLSYANSLAHLCARVDADVADVTRCMGADSRIGEAFLRPGPGWGGSCLPKDTAALVHTARAHGVALAEVEACRVTNAAQVDRLSVALQRVVGRSLQTMRIAALGLTFKSETSDTRDSPALTVCTHLSTAGAQVCGYDPQLNAIDPAVLVGAGITAVDDPYRATKAADVVVILTEWPQFAELDWAEVAQQAPDAVVVDTRNLLDPAMVRQVGLAYFGNGRPAGF
jgi:UDPglucose 6-dehydrogenase